VALSVAIPLLDTRDDVVGQTKGTVQIFALHGCLSVAGNPLDSLTHKTISVAIGTGIPTCHTACKAKIAPNLFYSIKGYVIGDVPSGFYKK
jgi:hypothetical protein